jgi:predicted nucleic acid-binding protein
MIHLDANFLCAVAVENLPAQEFCRDALRRGQSLATSSIAWTEFLNGRFAPLQVRRAANLIENRIVPFGALEAEVASRLFAVAGRKRGSLADCMIAATAIRAGAALATRNQRDFTPFASAGLRLA